MDLLKKSFELAKKPTDAVKLKGKANLTPAIILLALMGAISMGISSFAQGVFSFNITGAVTGLVMGAILGAILVPIVNLVFHGLVYLLAKAMGGKGTYTQQVYLVTLATVTASILIMLLGVIPCLGTLIVLVGGLYLLYVEVVVVRDLHQITTLKAAVAVVVPIIVLVLVAAFVAAVMFAALFAAMLGGGAMGAAYSGY